MKPVDKFGYPFEDYAEHISPEVEQRFKDVATMILYEAFRNDCTNPRDLGLHLMNIVREAQRMYHINFIGLNKISHGLVRKRPT